MAPPTPAAWTDIHSLVFKFKPHANKSFEDAHKQLNATYAQAVSGTALDELFVDSTRTTLKQDAIAILRDKIVDLITPLAIRTIDKQLVKRYTKDLPISSKMSSYLKPWRTSTDIEASLLFARKSKLTEITINLDINGLHFKPHTGPNGFFDPKKFEDISSTPFAVTTTTVPQSPGTEPNAPGQNTSAFTTSDMTTLGTAIGLALANHNPTSTSTTQPANNTGPTSTGPTSTGNLALGFKTDHLPPEVETRYLNSQDADYLMTHAEMVPFGTTDKDTRDPSGTTMRTSYYHMDPTFSGYRVYTRDGSCFQLTLPASPVACSGTNALVTLVISAL